MGFVAATVVTVLGATAAVVGGVAAGVAGAVAAWVAPVVAAVGGVVSTIASGVTAAIAPVITAVGNIASSVVGAITAPLGEVVTAVGGVVKNITAGVSKGIKDIGSLITSKTRPILEPIKNAWKAVKGRIDAVKVSLAPILEPFEEIADVVNTYHEVKILSGLLTGSKGVSQVIKYVGDGKLLEAASAISSLYHMTSEAVTGILEMQEAERKTFGEKLRYIDDAMRTLIEETQSKTLKEVYRKVHDVTGTITRKIGEVGLKLSTLERRTTDLPWFQEMLIRSLE